ncbi:LuxR family transcriptional regulator [Verrucosispora sp. NA02020]|uniref:helix-turn-helix transcriptional regulator n=1 Tax=Verrucosispora sp. NA02020 TaxID=2742132 RepID=UPI0015902401|nr:LuxR family transcriptional regulator [Verrucosispora sp. NA02020]QKW13534.1 AAA family ATPase [Verrucosispora sp. NA02020]
MVGGEADGVSNASHGRTTIGRQPGRASDPLVGRDGELHRLDQAIGRLTDGAQLIEISGDPGIGKSHLLAELTHRCQRRSLPVLTGRVPPGGAVFPFGALIDALDDRLRTVRADAWGALPTHDARVLADIFPSFPYRTENGPAPPTVPHFRRLRAIRSMLEVLASTGPLVVILDDLHRADDDTIDALCYLVQSPPQAATLLAFGYRTRQAPPRLRGAAARTGTSLVRLPLTPLSPTAVRTLLADCVSDAESDELYRCSGGNPRYLWALLDGARASTHDLTPARGTAFPVTGTAPEPATAQPGRTYSAAETAIAAELDELSSQSRLAAAGAAVVGEVFDLPAVGVVAELVEETVRRTIDELAGADIVRHVPDTTRFRFRHPLVRHVVYHGSQPGWRLGAHARAAAALAGTPDEEVARAPHLALVATPDDATAPGTLRRAAAAVERDSPETAARWRQAALRLTSVAGSPPADRHLLLRQVATAYAAAGRPRHARDMLLAALRQPVATPPAERADLVIRCVRLCLSLGEPAPARDLLAEEVTPPDPSCRSSRVNLLLEQAFLELADGSAVAARAAAITALRLAQDDRPRTTEHIRVKAVLAAADGLTGAFVSAAATLTDVVPLLDATGDAELAAHPDAIYWIGWSEFALERYPDALRHLERVRASPTDRPARAARPGPDVVTLCDALLARTWILAITGRHTVAVGTAAMAADVAYRSGSPHLRQRAAILRRWVAAERAGNRPGPRGPGPADSAPGRSTRWCAGGCAAGTSGRPGDAIGGCTDLSCSPSAADSGGWSAMLTRLMLAELRLAGGDPRGCLDLLTTVPALTSLRGVDPGTRMVHQELVVRAAVAAGDVTAVTAAAVDEVAPATGTTRQHVPAEPLSGPTTATRPHGAVGLALLARAQLLVTEEPTAAAEMAAAAAAELAAAGLTPAANRARTLARPADRQGSRRGGASETRHRNGRAALAGMTRRERQVAELVREGLTNREIAAVLVVTEKTVEMHLSHVFVKLGVRNRVRLARRLDAMASSGLPSADALPDPPHPTGED